MGKKPKLGKTINQVLRIQGRLLNLMWRIKWITLYPQKKTMANGDVI